MPRITAKPEAPTVNINMPPAPPQESAKDEPEEKSPTWFWEKINEIKKDEWGKFYNLLLMRQGNSKVPMADGYKGYLETFFEPVTLAQIKAKYGGGKYRMILEKNSRFVTSHDFDIEGAPNYDLTRERPSAAAPANGTTDAKLLNILESQIARLNEQLTASQAQGKQNPALTEAITILSTAYKEGLSAVGSGAAGGSGSLLDTIKTLKEMGLIGGGLGSDGLLGMVLKPLIEKLIQPQDPMSQVTMFLTIFEKLDALRGSGDSKGKDWKAMLAEGLVQKGPEILREIRETQQLGVEAARERRAAAETNARTAEIIRSVPGAQAAPRAAAAPSSGPVEVPGPMASSPLQVSPLDSPAGQEVSPVSADTGDFPQASTAAVKAADDAIAGWVKSRIVQLITEGEEAERIVDFIDIADPTVSELLVKYSEEIVSTFLAGDPVLKLAVQHANWKSFLAKARAYIQQSEALETATPN